MDSELLFISSLLSANKAEQDDFWLKQYPLSLFQLHEAEVHWVYTYRERHGKFPSLQAFNAKYDDLAVGFSGDPIAASLEPVLTQATYTRIRELTAKVGDMFANKKDPEEILSVFKEGAGALSSYTQSTVDEDLNKPQHAFRRYRQMTIDLFKGEGIVDTPWGPLTKLLTFSRPGEVITMVARMGFGKTWAVLYWADHLARKGIKTLIISKEMPSPQVADRLSAIRFRLDWEKYRSMSLDTEDLLIWKAKTIIAEAKEEYPLIVSGEETLEGIGIEQVYSKIMKERPRVVIIDGAYLLTTKSVGKQADDVQRFASLSRAAKRIAKVTQTTIILVLQNNRSAEKTQKNGSTFARGNLNTIYGSDAWAQDSDVVMELGGDRTADERIISVHKSRETRVGDVPINFKLSPFPNFTPKLSLSSSSPLAKLQLRILR